MVRTFLCHPFVEPKAFADHFEPTAMCFMQNDSLIISSSIGIIHIYDLKQDGNPRLHSFPSIGIAVSLSYSENKQFLVALETRVYDYKPMKSPRDLNCRVYIYWNINGENSSKAPTLVQAEYTNNAGESAYGMYMNKFPVIDLGIHDPVTDVSICKINDNIALSARNKVYIFAFKQINLQQSNADKVKFIDFFKIIEIDTSFHVRSLCIANNYVAFASRTEIRAIQVFISQVEDQTIYQGEDVTLLLEHYAKHSEKQSCVNNSIKLDDDFIVWSFNQADNITVSSSCESRKPQNFKEATNVSVSSSFESRKIQSINPTGSVQELYIDTDQKTIKLDAVRKEPPYTDGSSNSKEITGPVEDIVGHPLSLSFVCPSSNPEMEGTSVIATTLLYRRFESDEMSTSDTIDALHSLQWLPVFVQDTDAENIHNVSSQLWPWSQFQLPSFITSSIFPLFFSTGMKGYVYDVGSPVRHLVSYNYTSDCSSALHTDSLLYAVTMSGLEAYTSRLYPLAAELCSLSSKTNGADSKQDSSVMIMEKSDVGNRSQGKVDFRGLNYDPLQFNSDYLELSSETCYQNIFPAIPRYTLQSLLLPCPSSNLDVCLVGLFALYNICLVVSSSTNIGLLVKTAGKKDKHSVSDISPWTIYHLKKVNACSFHDELVRLIEGNESSNPTVYHQLLCEAHLILRSKLIVGSNQKDAIQFQLNSSARKIAEFLSRCDSSFDVTQICRFYSMGGVTFKDATSEYMEKDKHIKKESEAHCESTLSMKKSIFGHGMMLYLNSALFSNQDIELDQDIGDFILKVYAEICPSKLSEVILRSKLQDFTYEFAIECVDSYRRQQRSKGMMISHLDYLCLAVLQMNTGNPSQAESLLGVIPEDSRSKVCECHEFLLFDDSRKMTPFGQLIKKYFKTSLLSILVLMFNHGKIDVQQILDLFKQDHESKCTVYSYTACEVLESLLNDNANKKHFLKIALPLIDQYIHHISNMAADTFRNNHKHVPKGNGHFAPRFSWLNNMEPFTGEVSTPEECIVNNRESPASRNKNSEKANVENSLCTCCCCNEILLKFQSLLCSRHNRKELSMRMLSKLSDITFIGKESLLLLCWPGSDKAKEAVEYIVQKYPKLGLQYAKDMFDWKAQWQLLLQYLLTSLRSGEYAHWNHEAHIQLLKGVMLRLARAFTPAEFLAFLPDDGAVQFFLPYLRECWEFYKATSIKQHFLNTYRISDE